MWMESSVKEMSVFMQLMERCKGSYETGSCEEAHMCRQVRGWCINKGSEVVQEVSGWLHVSCLWGDALL